jgi:protein-S-isoprenylcysteine O-methyltransferase Ste14
LLSGLLVLLVVRDPALIAERENPPAGAQKWDQRLVRLYGLAMITVLIVAGLQERFGWPPAVSLAIHLIGLLGIISTVVLGAWAMRVNTYFSAYVRIQEDRHHTVVDQGPYRFVRHPGNLSMILWALGVALVLGSLWALLPAGLAAAMVVRRTQREDKTLLAELPGYIDYAGRVRYRILPGIW